MVGSVKTRRSGLVGFFWTSLCASRDVYPALNTTMTFVLVKWVSESKWDVYPVSCIEDAAIGYRLYTDRKSIGDLRGTIVNVRWDQNKDPEPATLLDLGRRLVLPFLEKLAAAGMPPPRREYSIQAILDEGDVLEPDGASVGRQYRHNTRMV
ncbi:hypothetical protein MRX96_013494 [Rhipicephalus microplus]